MIIAPFLLITKQAYTNSEFVTNESVKTLQTLGLTLAHHYSYDGTHIVSGSDDKSVRVWGASIDAEQQQLNGHTPIVSGSDEKSIWVRNRIDHGVIWTSNMDGWIVSLPGHDRLVWMPQGIREVIYHPYNTLVISQKGYAHIDFQGCNVGTKWAECYKPLVV